MEAETVSNAYIRDNCREGRGGVKNGYFFQFSNSPLLKRIFFSLGSSDEPQINSTDGRQTFANCRPSLTTCNEFREVVTKN